MKLNSILFHRNNTVANVELSCKDEIQTLLLLISNTVANVELSCTDEIYHYYSRGINEIYEIYFIGAI